MHELGGGTLPMQRDQRFLSFFAFFLYFSMVDFDFILVLLFSLRRIYVSSFLPSVFDS